MGGPQCPGLGGPPGSARPRCLPSDIRTRPQGTSQRLGSSPCCAPIEAVGGRDAEPLPLHSTRTRRGVEGCSCHLTSPNPDLGAAWGPRTLEGTQGAGSGPKHGDGGEGAAPWCGGSRAAANTRTRKPNSGRAGPLRGRILHTYINTVQRGLGWGRGLPSRASHGVGSVSWRAPGDGGGRGRPSQQQPGPRGVQGAGAAPLLLRGRCRCPRPAPWHFSTPGPRRPS